MPTYRSQVAITTLPLRAIAYDKLAILFSHANGLNINVTRVQLMPDNFVEIDTNVNVPVAQLDHFGLMGPV